jgi:hypothetical protein
MKYFVLTMVALCTFLCAGPGMSAEPTADDYRAFFEYLDGTWDWCWDDVKATYTFKWAGTKRCLIGEGRRGDGVFAATSFDFYDPKAKSWRRQIVWRDGAVTTEVAKLPLEVLKGDLDGTEFEVEMEAALPNGEVQRGKNTYHIINRNHWKVELFTGTKVDLKRK